eukprot:gnl/MRDRNA2_/MRDRNA2_90342_c0_seq1.p1 gnl/MRDRNA2_/MRDRNA2_90342_c0~~gnl/MRDRNA2_/MRDRNA2_90342_c0_seq1.p1  ORF type:complete len:323 (-),score=130.17 gnl/MRDRNA2_/MRDRNA2_90342_c0_seq1:37-942(-)
MTEPPSLGDFFAKKKTKKVKASNLNNVSTPGTEKKPEKKKEKDADAAGWKDVDEIAPSMPAMSAGIEVGKLVREQDEEEEESKAPAWGKSKNDKEVKRSERDEKRFPELRAAMGFSGSSNINIDDGSDAKINISTSKNVFAALEGEEEEDDDGTGKKKRPKEIKPAMVSKQKGEREKDVLKKEVDKYLPGGPPKIEEDDDSPEAKEKAEAKARKAEKKAEKEERRNEKKNERKDDDKENEKQPDSPAGKVQADCLIPVDEEKARLKYMGRKKLPKKDLPLEELEDPNVKKPKKKVCAVEDF